MAPATKGLLEAGHGVGGERDDRTGVALATQLGGRRVAIHLGHLHVHEDDVEGILRERGGERLFHRNAAVLGDGHACSGPREVGREEELVVEPSSARSTLQSRPTAASSSFLEDERGRGAVRLFAAREDADAARPRELDGVAHQVHEHLTQARGIVSGIGVW